MTQIGLKGGRELAAFLDAFPAKLQKGAVRAGLVAAARPIRDQARANVARKSGLLARAIKTGSANFNADGLLSIKVRMKGKHGFLGYFMEYGVTQHLIKAAEEVKPTRRKKDGTIVAVSMGTINKMVKRGSLRIGDNFVGPMVIHPGFAPTPFMRPALDTKAKDAIEAFGARVRSYLKDKSGLTAPAVLEVDE